MKDGENTRNLKFLHLSFSFLNNLHYAFFLFLKKILPLITKFWDSFTSAKLNILLKPLAAFPHGHLQNNGQLRGRNKSCHADYNQFMDRISQAGDQASDLRFSSPVFKPNATQQLRHWPRA